MLLKIDGSQPPQIPRLPFPHQEKNVDFPNVKDDAGKKTMLFAGRRLTFGVPAGCSVERLFEGVLLKGRSIVMDLRGGGEGVGRSIFTGGERGRKFFRVPINRLQGNNDQMARAALH